MKIFNFIFLIAVLFSAPGIANAYKGPSMRCGNGIIERGMDRQQLIKECGSKWVPAEIRTRIKYYTTKKSIKHFVKSLPASANTYQYWVYRFYGGYETIIWLTNGRVVKIEVTSKRVD